MRCTCAPPTQKWAEYEGDGTTRGLRHLENETKGAWRKHGGKTGRGETIFFNAHLAIFTKMQSLLDNGMSHDEACKLMDNERLEVGTAAGRKGAMAWTGYGNYISKQMAKEGKRKAWEDTPQGRGRVAAKRRRMENNEQIASSE